MVQDYRSVTDADLEEALGYMGKPAFRGRQQWNAEVTADAVRHFAWGIGDDNPLWHDDDYARQSVHGRLLAPPTFVMSCDSGAVIPGLESLARVAGGQAVEFFGRVAVGDRLTSEAEATGARKAIGKRLGPMIVQSGTASISNQDGALVAKVTHHALRIGRHGEKPDWAYEPRPHRYSDDELRAIEADVLSEGPRGAEDRFFDDVEVGDAVGPLTKGPYTLTDMICWYAGSGVYGRRPFRLAWREKHDNPDWYTVVPETGGFEYSDRGHYDDYVARQHGMPGPFDNPMQRCSLIAHLFTDWMGDSGFLSTIDCRYTAPFVFGDTMRITAVVAGKTERSATEGLVTFHLRSHDQFDVMTTKGTASVVLPRRPSR
jgi:acyl dehydratase